MRSVIGRSWIILIFFVIKISLPQSEQWHLVQKGETLFSIAHKYGTSIDELVRLNKISNPNFIRFGVRLKIPTQPTLKVPVKISPKNIRVSAFSPKQVKVQTKPSSKPAFFGAKTIQAKPTLKQSPIKIQPKPTTSQPPSPPIKAQPKSINRLSSPSSTKSPTNKLKKSPFGLSDKESSNVTVNVQATPLAKQLALPLKAIKKSSSSPPASSSQSPSGASSKMSHQKKQMSKFSISRILQVQVGKLVVLTVPPLRSASIANPAIADLQILRAGVVGVLGKNIGSTSLVLVTDKQVFVWEVVVIPEPFPLERLKNLIGIPTVKVELIKDTIVLTGTVPSQVDRERAGAVARLFFERVIDLLRVVEEKPIPPEAPPLPSPQEIQTAIGVEGIKVSIVGDTVVLEGTVKTTDELARIEKVVSLLAPKVINLIKVRPLSSQELQDLIAIATVKVRETPEALVLEGEVSSQEELQRINEIANQARRKVINWVKVLTQPALFDFAARVQEAINIPTLQVKGDEKGLILTGTVNTQAEKERALRIASFLLGYFGTQPPPGQSSTVGQTQQVDKILDLVEVKGGRQIRVEVQLIEINRTALRDLGVSYPELTTTGVKIGQAENPATGGVTGVAQRTPITALLKMLEQENIARSLSSPNTVVLTGQKAEFKVGGELPIPVVTTAPGIGQSVGVEFRPFGIILTVTPSVEPSGKLSLKVKTEVSELDFSIAVVIAGANIPGTRTRAADTQVELNSGETLVMSGLVQRIRQETIKRIPILSKIPILGELFTSRRFQDGETELAILITPTLIQPTPTQPD